MYFSGWYLYGERSIRTHSTKRRSEQSWIQEKTHCFPPAMNSCFWCFTFNKFFLMACAIAFDCTSTQTDDSFPSSFFVQSILASVNSKATNIKSNSMTRFACRIISFSLVAANIWTLFSRCCCVRWVKTLAQHCLKLLSRSCSTYAHMWKFVVLFPPRIR